MAPWRRLMCCRGDKDEEQVPAKDPKQPPQSSSSGPENPRWRFASWLSAHASRFSFCKVFRCFFPKKNKKENRKPDSANLQPQARFSNAASAEQPDESNYVTDLQMLLEKIDKAIDRAGKLSNQKTPIGEPAPKNSNDEKAENVIEKVVGVLSKCKPDEATQALINKGKDEVYNVLSDSIRGLGNVHWVATGLSVVSYVLDRFDMVASNRDGCMRLMENLSRLGHHIEKLIPCLEEGDKNLRSATSLITRAAVLCFTQFEASYGMR